MKFADRLMKLQRKVVFTPVKPEKLECRNNNWFIDFGRDAFGTLELELDSPDNSVVEIRLGEVLGANGFLYSPEPKSLECNRRFRKISLLLKEGRHCYRLTLPEPGEDDYYQCQGYNCASARSVLCPRHIGEVMPFRYTELHGFKGKLCAGDVRQLTAHYPFDDNASDFHCSDKKLESVWGLCKHTIKSVSFPGIYIDGDRERMPYEGDSLVQQLSNFCFSTDFLPSETTLEWFCELGTSWCYEWVLSLPVLAWRHYLYSGDNKLLKRYYSFFELATLISLERADGLLATGQDCREPSLINRFRPPQGFLRDVIDWPPVMRDNYELGTINTVANSFHFAALEAMGNIAAALNKNADKRRYLSQAERVRLGMLKCLLNPDTGLFVDSEGSKHSSLHAVIFPVACGVIKPEPASSLTTFLSEKSMDCSVWAAQFFLDALYIAGLPEKALSLMASDGERSWLNMIKQGATMTMEAWSNELKSSQDWNHPWATAPANIMTRRLMGIRPLTPGFDHVIIAPEPGRLTAAGIVSPTRHGQIKVDFSQEAGKFSLTVEIPEKITAEVHLPYGISGFVNNDKKERTNTFYNIKSGKYSFSAELP